MLERHAIWNTEPTLPRTPRAWKGCRLDSSQAFGIAPAKTRQAQETLNDQSDDGGRYRQASTAVVFHPSSPPHKETTHG